MARLLSAGQSAWAQCSGYRAETRAETRAQMQAETRAAPLIALQRVKPAPLVSRSGLPRSRPQPARLARSRHLRAFRRDCPTHRTLPGNVRNARGRAARQAAWAEYGIRFHRRGSALPEACGPRIWVDRRVGDTRILLAIHRTLRLRPPRMGRDQARARPIRPRWHYARRVPARQTQPSCSRQTEISIQRA